MKCTALAAGRRRLWILLGILSWQAGLGAAPASAQVLDNGGYFSQKAVNEANAMNSAMRLRGKTGLIVETFAQMPEHDLEAYQAMDATARWQYFADWAKKRADEHSGKGMYVLICSKPARVQGARIRPALSAADGKKLIELFTTNLDKKQLDQALLEAMAFVRSKIAPGADDIPVLEPQPLPKLPGHNANGPNSPPPKGSAGIALFLQNSGPSKIHVISVVRVNKTWRTLAAQEVAPGQKVGPIAHTDNRSFYYYAYSADRKIIWNGKELYRSVAGQRTGFRRFEVNGSPPDFTLNFLPPRQVDNEAAPAEESQFGSF